MRYVTALIVAAVSTVGVGAQDVTPPQLAEDQLVVPALPGPTVVGWGEVFLEVTVGPDGRVTELRSLRAAAPFDELLRTSVAGWRFAPALDGEEAVESHVLVAAVYRPRVLHHTPAAGTPPVDADVPSGAIPYPIHAPAPPHPARAIGDGVVVVEALVDAGGGVTTAEVMSPATGFDASALDTARAWRFDAARPEGTPSEAYVYLVFAFREPVVAGGP